jgi:indolepyruvate ferredoxin oxidoreductase alpha subunit
VAREILLGNAAIARGAINAGVRLVAGYPGTPSTEILQTVAAYNQDKSIHVEWSTNEKAALEVAAGAAYSGVRALVTMKQVGLNVASDALMSLVYVGVKGGLVLVVADDPGPISSQTEQDTRFFGAFANAPVLDPSSPEEAYAMVGYAFELSEFCGLPVILRPTTKVCHATAVVEVAEERQPMGNADFVKDERWVIFPPLSYRRHGEIEVWQKRIAQEFESSPFNELRGAGKLGIAAGGVTWAMLQDAYATLPPEVQNSLSLLKVGAVYPPPHELYRRFLTQVERLLVLEELDPVIEEGLIAVMGREALTKPLTGKTTGAIPPNGELRLEAVSELIGSFLQAEVSQTAAEVMSLPARAPVLCAGCPHRASFYVVKRAMRGQKAVYCGDIGCYTLGNAAPLQMTDTCLCMGAGITLAQGIAAVDESVRAFAFIGDSTFFASGMTGLVNAVYNRADLTIVILDNGTTAMTGNQPHPGTGRNMMGEQAPRPLPAEVARALGAGFVAEADPYEVEKASEIVKKAVAYHGVSVIVFQAPCTSLLKNTEPFAVANCTGCGLCLRELGCPGMVLSEGLVAIESSLCNGCGLCACVCPSQRIHKREVSSWT